MKSLFGRVRAVFSKPLETPQPTYAPEPEEDRLQVLVGRQRVITRGRGSTTGSEGLVRDAI